MKFTLFLGCNIPARVPQYQDAAQAVCRRLGIQLIQNDNYECCGYPSRSIDEFAFVLSAARNLALAADGQHSLMVLCKCCFGSLKMAQHRLNENKELRNRVNRILEKENLTYSGNISIRHFLSVLHEDLGVKKLKTHIKKKFKDLNIAASVGCHALRPAKITRFDNAAKPSLFDDLVKLTGAKAVTWSKQSDCCGAPILGINDALSLKILDAKITNALKNSAHFIAVGCPYSFLQFDRLQFRLVEQDSSRPFLVPVLYPQLLGLCMGIEPTKLGFSYHMGDIDLLTSYLTQEKSHA